MTTTPITDAEEIIRKSIFQAISPLMSAYTWTPSGESAHIKCYWKVARQNAPRPFVVYQPQADIIMQPLLNGMGTQTLITVKGIADTQSAAAALLALIAPGMLNLAIPAGYAGYDAPTSLYVRSPQIPPTVDGVWQSAHIYQVTFYRS